MKDFILSTDKVSRRYNRNFKILTEGINLDRFKSNPIMLFNHNKDNVLGVWDNIRIEDNKLIATAKFDDDEDSMKIAKKVEKGTLKTASVGVEILKFDEDNENFTILESELYETSIVSVPQNSDAQTLILMSGGKEIELDEFIKNNNSNMSKEDKTKQLTEDLKASNVELTLNIENKDKEIVELSKEITKFTEDLKEKDLKIEELTNKINDFEKEKFNNLLDNAVKDGKISENSKEQFTDLSYDKAKSIIDSLSSTNASLSVDLNKIKDNDGVKKDYDWYLKNDKEALRCMAKEQPELYKELENNIK